MTLKDLEQYNYELPKELIRTKGVEPRDSARLFVYNTATDTVILDTFKNIATYLPEKSLMVLNDTLVLPARLWLQKETGGKIEVLVLLNQLDDEEKIPVIVDRKVSVGQKLFFPNQEYFEVVWQEENTFYVRLEGGKDQLYKLLEEFGETPIPHYLEDAAQEEDSLRKRYQTIFAKSTVQEKASVAAPTASLHFTERVFESLDKKGIKKSTLTLDVGMGTFAPLSDALLESGKLHKEYVEVLPTLACELNEAKQNKTSIIAVGTTVTRTLEAIAASGTAEAYQGPVDIFIYPPYEFKAVDILITNFHLPKTSLMLLVQAFLDHKGSKRDIMSLYEEAIEEQFSFYSFGDSMLII